ncbi:MAG: Holliday junction resolvase RuvX [Acidimicrobiales bacterium]
MTGRPGRVLGLDLGTKRIGVAVCDDARTIATPLDTVHRVGDRTVEHRAIAELMETNQAVALVVGMPFGLDGGRGPAAKTIASEVKALRRRLGVEVWTHDERLTTVTAERSLREQGRGGRRGRPLVDQLAAAVILQAWIDAGAPTGA